MLWWFQLRYYSSFNDHWVTFKGEELVTLALRPKKTQALVVNFVDPKCPCSRFAFPHIADLKTRFNGRAEFVDFTSLSQVSPYYSKLASISVPASPSVAIWSKDGALVYFGPYSSGDVCGSGEDFVASMLNALQKGGKPFWINQEAVGCFCEWPKHEKNDEKQ